MVYKLVINISYQSFDYHNNWSLNRYLFRKLISNIFFVTKIDHYLRVVLHWCFYDDNSLYFLCWRL